MFTWDDLQSFCDDLSNWIIELDFVGEMEKAFPKGEFPLKANPKEDNLEQGLDVLLYLTLWMCIKANTKAPSHLESRIILSPKTNGPWKELYARLCSKMDQQITIKEIYDLAG